MSKTEVVSVPGKTFINGKYENTKPLNIMYDDDEQSGQHIDYRAFIRLVSSFGSATNNPASSDPNVAFYFSKRLLLFLLSFDNCHGLIISNCYNEETGRNSVALCAVDDKKDPLGRATNAGSPERFAGGEWGFALSLSMMKAIFQNFDVNTFDKSENAEVVQNFFDALKNKS